MRQVKFDSKLCLGCLDCETACALEHSELNDLYESINEKSKPLSRLHIKKKEGKLFLQICKNCKKPRCIETCETGAIYKKDDYVIVDYNRCNGCWECINACQFRSIGKDEYRSKIIMCDLCIGRKPSCVNSCITGALKLVEDEDDK